MVTNGPAEVGSLAAEEEDSPVEEDGHGALAEESLANKRLAGCSR